MRENSDSWLCIVCGEESSDIICRDCSQREKEKQREASGSVTEKQIKYINHLLYKTNCDFDGDLYGLNVKDAGKLISDLVGWIEDGHEKPLCVKIGAMQPCMACGKQIRASGYYVYCHECHTSIFQCHAKKKNGEQCSNRVSVPNGFCHVHSNASQQSVQATMASSRLKSNPVMRRHCA